MLRLVFAPSGCGDVLLRNSVMRGCGFTVDGKVRCPGTHNGVYARLCRVKLFLCIIPIEGGDSCDCGGSGLWIEVGTKIEK